MAPSPLLITKKPSSGSRRVLIPLAVALAIVGLAGPGRAKATNVASESWRNVQLGESASTYPLLKACGIKAAAKCGGEFFTAFVYVWGRAGSGLPKFNVVVNGLDGTIPASELADFEGPDLSSKALDTDVVAVKIQQDPGAKEYAARLIMSQATWLPRDVRGAGDVAFQLNFLGPGRKSSDKIATQLLGALSQGFTSGQMVIGEGILSKAVTVTFGGDGAQSCFATLARHIATPRLPLER